MSSYKKIYLKLISGKSDSNINFIELCNFLEYLGFTKRIKGSHHIFRIEGINTKITLQKDGAKAKSYQVKQVRKLIIENNLGDFNV
jgi:predicted RNA binding protein YcfA (HicA-like mRNA interferase family)